jgi:hypothetical protein
MFASALFTESVRYRFGLRPDIREITSFLAGIRMTRTGGQVSGFPMREAEALIRAVLGEMLMLETVDADVFSLPEIAISVMDGLFLEGLLSPVEWESLLWRAEQVLEEGLKVAPQLAVAEDDWFAAGMANSPFVSINDKAPVHE